MARGCWAVLAMVLIVAGCREAGPDKGLFEVSGRMVVFNYRVAVANFLINLAPTKPVGEGLVAVARFDDPAGGDAIEVRQKIWPKLGRVTLESPPLSCIVRDRPYAVSIAIVGADGVTLQTIETTMTSSQDQDVLPDLPLVVGPGYKPNPALAGHPGGKVPGSHPPCPDSGKQ